MSKKSHQEEIEKLNTQCRTVSEDLARLKQEHSDLKQEHHSKLIVNGQELRACLYNHLPISLSCTIFCAFRDGALPQEGSLVLSE